MILFPVSSAYAAICGLLLLVLSARVVQLRRRERIGIGDGNHADLARRIRVHANAVETIPIVLILLALSEAGGAPVVALHVAGAGFVLARVLHAIGFSRSAGYSFGRFWGTLLTWLAILGLALYLLLGVVVRAIG